ncbi:hypothetical protein L1887_48386 [Cichorium endivia]|nr:hypothetical protein L1887_48386 [Cichorium endivia]
MDVADEHESGCECDGVDDGGDVAVWKVVESLDEGPDSDGRDTLGWRLAVGVGSAGTHALLLLLLPACLPAAGLCGAAALHSKLGAAGFELPNLSRWRCSALGQLCRR